MAPPYGGAYNPGGGGGHMTTSASQYPLIQPNGSGTASPAAGSVGRGTYQWPAQAYPQTYTVAGRQFASAEGAGGGAARRGAAGGWMDGCSHNHLEVFVGGRPPLPCPLCVRGRSVYEV
jgi:hypothetical protein